MFWKKKLKQEGAKNSTNLQGQNVTINNGITYSDAKEIALDIFKSNFLELSQTAALTATSRAEKLVENFLEKVYSEMPERIEKIQDPDMQYAIFTAQKEYARSGEENMEEMLIKILTERIGVDGQTLKKIVLNESLQVLPKLTDNQLDILTIVFLTHETVNNEIVDLETFKNYLILHYIPFITELRTDRTIYKHLEFTGCCGSIGIPDDNFSNILSNRYLGLFSKGFDKQKFIDITKGDEKYNVLLMECINDATKYQLNVMNESVLKATLDKHGLGQELYLKFEDLLKKHKMSVQESDKLLISLVPEIETLISTWKNSYLCVMNTTSVGIMLAYLNLKRKSPEIDFDINKWIKE